MIIYWFGTFLQHFSKVSSVAHFDWGNEIICRMRTSARSSVPRAVRTLLHKNNPKVSLPDQIDTPIPIGKGKAATAPMVFER